MNRKKIFISHANREDNLFAFWLATKLSLSGYDVWCDVREFSGGEYMWNEINDTLENETVKFIFVLSQASIKKQGPLNELAKALAVANKYSGELKNFVIPIRLDDFNYLDSRPELINIFSIEFNNRWAQGLNELLSKFDKENVPINNKDDHQKWLKQIFYQYFDTALVEKNEILSTNWFPIISSNIVTIAKTESKISKEKLDNYSFPLVKQNDYLITFSDMSELQKSFPILDFEIQNESDFLNSAKGISFRGEIISKDSSSRIYIELLNQALNNEFSRKSNKYELSQNSCYYYTLEEIPSQSIKIEPYHKRPKKIIGNFRNNYWHFAISGFSRLYPLKAVTFKSHILFSPDGNSLFENNAKQHRMRRQISKNKFNNFWKNGLLNLIYYHSKDGLITIDIGNTLPLEISVEPLLLNSIVGLDESKIKRILNEESEVSLDEE